MTPRPRSNGNSPLSSQQDAAFLAQVMDSRSHPPTPIRTARMLLRRRKRRTNSQPTLRNAHRMDPTTPEAGSTGLASASVVANMRQTTKSTCGALDPQIGSAARTSPRFRMNNSEDEYSGRRAYKQGERLHTVCRRTNSLRNTYTAPVRQDILNLYTFMTAGMQAGHHHLMTP
jgi:hypothetical protein